MRLQISTSKNSKSLYVIRSIYENGRHSSKVVEKLGTYDQLLKQLNGEDPIAWAKKYVDELNKQEKIDQRAVLVKYSPVKRITKDEQNVFNGGYLFLQKIYFSLGLHETCKQIVNKYKFTFNMDSILSRLVYSRILFPSSKLETLNLSKRFIEQPDFDLQHIYRALSIIAKESEFIQTELYKNSQRICKRNTNILYYDCTNYFFEIEQEAGLKQYGPSKEHRPNPIVQMGLFMDGDGIPLAFNINKGNTNEQVTLTPLEEKILKDFEISKFVVCTDAGLASTNNRKFNNNRNRAFITTQSIKKLKKPLREWALDEAGWRISGSSCRYNLNSLADSGDKSFKNQTFYKERWIKEDTLEQKLIVTYSLKYRDYQRQIHKNQIERAMKMIDDNPQRIHKCSQNDFKRLIAKKSITSDGEIADKNLYSIDADLIAKEEVFDGFYGVCTNLEDDASAIIKINHQRWKIEESFRIMKTEFKARPVYLSRDDRISAHFTTCFIALTLYRLLERQLNERFTNREIIQGLQNMNFYKVAGEGYIPAYTRNDFTDALHETFKFQTDYQIVNTHQMKNIFKATKS
ncbi:IS1634 family transposase [Pectinatus frisingensis]|uniref:IS1634 family transposase n=1 Tax=Pectinatus frisingensis TaxID=865 RepID=UPI0018C78532|nr:IS1634 family transposase [Pectinatus frisingensis]